MIIKDLGAVSAYAYAVEKGYTGTEEEFAELMASYATVAEEAAESAESASASAESASASAQTATTKAGEASTSATQAGASATSASQSAQTATTKASEASASASTASTKASEASQLATTASTKASEASASATSAQTAQGLAEVARDDAIDAKTDAESARDLAQQYAESIDPENIFSAYPTDTASGAVATFADGADDIPMKSVKVAIEPVQDLHGYDHPWPGGGGKNLFDEENATIYSRYFKSQDGAWVWAQISDSASVAFPCTPGVTYTVSTQNSELTIFRVGTIEQLPSTSSDAPVISDVTRLTQSGSVTITPGDNAQYIVIQCANSIMNNRACKLQIELGSTATDYAPYSNICPISGFTETRVVRTRKNLLGGIDLGNACVASIPSATLDTTAKTIAFRANADTNSSNFFPAPFKENTQYTFILTGSNTLSGGYSNMRIRYTDGTYGYVPNSFTTTKGTFAFTTSSGKTIERVFKANMGGITTLYYDECGVFEGALTVDDFEPFGNTYSVTFPSEAGTVYGGELDVTNGVLTVDRAFIASYNGETLPSEWISDRDKYVAGTTPTTGAQVCYKLSQAVVYTLTPTEIKSLLGDNNIWADAGDTTVTYRADTAKYIDKKIAEVINALS